MRTHIKYRNSLKMSLSRGTDFYGSELKHREGAKHRVPEMGAQRAQYEPSAWSSTRERIGQDLRECYPVRQELPLQLLTVVWNLDTVEANRRGGPRKVGPIERTKLLHAALLAQTERYIRESERHLLHQRQIVDELERHGRGNSQTANIARDILASFEMARAAHIADRARYREVLEQTT